MVNLSDSGFSSEQTSYLSGFVSGILQGKELPFLGQDGERRFTHEPEQSVHDLFFVSPAQESLMLRRRIAGGALTSGQWRGLAGIASTWGPGHAPIHSEKPRPLRPAAEIQHRLRLRRPRLRLRRHQRHRLLRRQSHPIDNRQPERSGDGRRQSFIVNPSRHLLPHAALRHHRPQAARHRLRRPSHPRRNHPRRRRADPAFIENVDRTNRKKARRISSTWPPPSSTSANRSKPGASSSASAPPGSPAKSSISSSSRPTPFFLPPPPISPTSR